MNNKKLNQIRTIIVRLILACVFADAIEAVYKYFTGDPLHKIAFLVAVVCGYFFWNIKLECSCEVVK